MPRLYKRGAWWWAAYCVGGESFRESCRTKNKKAARTWARRREVELADPTVAATKTATLRAALVSLVEDRRAAGRAPRTLEFYEAMAGPLLRILGDSSLADLKPSDVDLYIRQRLGESAAAQPDDIDWDGGTVRLRGTKTRRSARVVPILSSTRCYLVAAHRCMPFGSWGRSNASRDLNAAADRAGVGRLRPTDLRRTAAMWLRQSGASASAIAEYLGHTSSRMVEQVYGRLQGVELGKLLERETAG